MNNKVLLFLLLLTGSLGSVAQTGPFPCRLLSVDSVLTCKVNPKLIAVTITNHDTAQTWGPTYICVINSSGDTVGSETMCGCVILFKGKTGTFNVTARDTNFQVPPNFCCTLLLKGSSALCPKTYGNCTLTGISSPVTGKEALGLFPNPASTRVTLDLGHTPSGEVLISVVNMQGRKVFSEVVNSQNIQLDVSALPKGIYLVQLSGGGIPSASRKMIID